MNLLIYLLSDGQIGHISLTNFCWQFKSPNLGLIFDICWYSSDRSAAIRLHAVMACSSSSTGPRPGLPMAILGPGGPQNLHPLVERDWGTAVPEPFNPQAMGRYSKSRKVCPLAPVSNKTQKGFNAKKNLNVCMFLAYYGLSHQGLAFRYLSVEARNW